MRFMSGSINRFYSSQSPAFGRLTCRWEGFEWLVADDNHNNVVVFRPA